MMHSTEQLTTGPVPTVRSDEHSTQGPDTISVNYLYSSSQTLETAKSPVRTMIPSVAF